jgi:hypothetical protein
MSLTLWFEVLANGNSLGTFAATDVEAFCLGGNDTIRAAVTVIAPLKFAGGQGNDVLIGGPGTDQNSAGSGDDTVIPSSHALCTGTPFVRRVAPFRLDCARRLLAICRPPRHSSRRNLVHLGRARGSPGFGF